MSDRERLLEEGLRHLGEESVFTELVLRYLPEKEWSRKLRKSHFGHADDSIKLYCESTGIVIRKGRTITVLSYRRAYDIIADMIRREEWLPKEKMVELARRVWGND